MGENKIESLKQYGDASGISSHYLFKRLKLHSVRNMLCTCIVWCDETAMMIEYCAKNDRSYWSGNKGGEKNENNRQIFHQDL